MEAVGEEFCYTREHQLGPEKIVTEGFVELPAGCSWAKKHGGCRFCSFQKAVDGYTSGCEVGSGEFIDLFLLGHRLITGVEKVNVFTGGSFWDGVPQKAQRDIARLMRDDPHVRQVNIESRPEFISSAKLTEIKALLGSTKLRVAIGLETQDDHLRNRVLNKGMSRRKFEEAVDLLKERGCRVAVYVLLKPHKDLGEAEAIEEATKTIQYVKRCGVDVVLLQAMMVMPGSLSDAWFRSGEFCPPWLWSIIEVIKETSHLLPVRLGKFEDSPSPVAVPSNCWRCDPVVNAALDQYRRTMEVAVLENAPTCSCRDTWQKQISAS
jgi:radical SAM enzyme (TIGR01210 family)